MSALRFAQISKLNTAQKTFVASLAAGALFVGMAVANTGWAAASNSEAAASHEENETVIIHAPELVVKRMPASGRPNNVQNAEVITGEKPVSFADLDLSKPSDVAELEKRISATARDICQELNRRYPRTSFQVIVDKDCVKSAVDEGMGVVKDLVATNTK
jgi:UrcA family protein